MTARTDATLCFMKSPRKTILRSLRRVIPPRQCLCLSCVNDSGRRPRYGGAVPTLRRLVLTRPALAMLVIVLVIGMRLLSPTGFMPVVAEGRLVISLCPGTASMPAMGMAMATATAMSMPGMSHAAQDDGGHESRSEPPCTFAGISALSLAAVDATLLGLAILFVVTRGARTTIRPRVGPAPRLHPPSRAPPKGV